MPDLFRPLAQSPLEYWRYVVVSLCLRFHRLQVRLWNLFLPTRFSGECYHSLSLSPQEIDALSGYQVHVRYAGPRRSSDLYSAGLTPRRTSVHATK